MPQWAACKPMQQQISSHHALTFPSPCTPAGGLNKLAELLEVQRIGPQHQAGSDSLLTSLTFLKLARRFFTGVDGLKQHMGILYGLGVDGENGFAKAQFDQ